MSSTGVVTHHGGVSGAVTAVTPRPGTTGTAKGDAHAPRLRRRHRPGAGTERRRGRRLGGGLRRLSGGPGGDGRAGPGRARRVRGRRLRRGAPRRDDRDLGAAPRAAGRTRRGQRGGRGRRAGGHAPAVRHRAHGTGTGVAAACGTPPRPRLGDPRSRVVRGGAHLRAVPQRRPRRCPGLGRAGHRGRLAHRSGRSRARAGGAGPAGDPRRRRRAGSGAPRRRRGGRDVRGPRRAVHRSRLLRAGVRPAGPGPVRPGRAMDRGDGALGAHERDRQPARPLPGAPGRDSAPARPVCRRRAAGAAGLRRAAPLPAPRAGLAADRAGPDPAAARRPERCRGSAARRAPPRMGSRTRALARPARRRRHRHGGRLDPGGTGAAAARAVEGAAPPPPGCAGHHCSTPR